MVKRGFSTATLNQSIQVSKAKLSGSVTQGLAMRESRNA